MKVALFSIFVVIAGIDPAWAQSPATQPREPKPQVRVVELALSPAAEPRPALKYALLPGLSELTPGDGMCLYYTTMDQLQRASQDEALTDKIFAWHDTPASRMDWRQVKDTVDGFGQLADLDIAARFASCQWNLPVDKRGISTYLPSLSRWRLAARLVSAKARVEIHEGRFDDAAYTMRTGFAMARHAADGPTIIQALVGAAMTDIMARAVEDLVRQPGSPNLYWALAALPHPFIDARSGLQGETMMFYGTFPDLREGKNAKLTDEQWNNLLRRVIQTIGGVHGADEYNQTESLMLEAFTVYRQAKDHFRAQGLPAEQVDAMPVGKAVLLYEIEKFEQRRDDCFKWWSLPYWQGERGFRLADEQVKKYVPASLIGNLLPSLFKAYAQFALREANLSALQTIEAIRMHAAQTGQLPATLQDITIVPLPVDPLTGHAFTYHLEGDTGILDIIAPTQLSNLANTRYELTIRK